MGNPRMHVLFILVYAHALPLDPNSRTFRSCIPKQDPLQLSQGVMICVTGLGLLVASDQLTNKDWDAVNKGKGDAFMILGASLYGFSASCAAMVLAHKTDRNLVANATEEFLVRKRPLYEVVGQLGMWGVVINGIQASALEHKQWKESTWSGENSMLLRPSFSGFRALHGTLQLDFWWLTQLVRISLLK